MMNLTPWGKNDETAVARFEEKLGFPLPADYRDFLKKSNGGSIRMQVFFVEGLGQDVMMDVLYGITNDESADLTLDTWLQEYQDELPAHALIVGSDPGGGMVMYITQGEDIGMYYWDHAHFFPQSTEEDGNTYFLADSFAKFCDSLVNYVPKD